MGITTDFPGNAPSYRCLRYSIIAAITISPNYLMPSFGFIPVNKYFHGRLQIWCGLLIIIFLGFMSIIMCCTEGYYFPLNIISSISIPYTAEPLLGLEFFPDIVSVCSGMSSFCGSLSASYISSSCTSFVSYYFIFLLVYSDSCSTLLSSSTTVFPSSSSTHCGPFKRFVSSVFFSSSSYL